MANLTFTADHGQYVSGEVIVDANFNLHLERTDAGACHIKVKTANGQFVPAATISGGAVIDIDVYAYVFPKTIIVISASKVEAGFCTMGDAISSDRPKPEVKHEGHFLFADGAHFITADGKYYKVK